MPTEDQNGVKSNTTNKILVIKSIPERPVARFETSRQGLQVWSISPINIAPTPCVVGIEWKDVEKALAHAVEQGHYTLEKLNNHEKGSKDD